MTHFFKNILLILKSRILNLYLKVFLSKSFPLARCLKITEKVSFNNTSEASYVYILSKQKLIKNAKNGQFCEFLKI